VRQVLSFSILILAGMMSAAISSGQTFTGGVSGVVADQSGAMVSDATLTLTNRDTGERRSVKSSQSGTYSFAAVPPGRYRLEVEHGGFKKVTQEPVEVRVQQFVSLDVMLQVGEVSESVQVEARAALIDPNTSSLSQVVGNQQITQLPLNGRNTLAFVQLTPGVRMQGLFGENPATVNFQAWGNFSANGGVANTNEVLVDGAPVSGYTFANVNFLPPVDATQEFRVQTNTYSAEFGRSGGAVVNLSIKSGTNALHGSVYEFFRNDRLDANDFFLNRAGRSRPQLRYNQFGAAVGGPIIRNRAFFFGNWESFRQLSGIALTSTVPTALERAGDYSQTFLPNGTPRVIADPLTKQPLPGNRIPASAIDPVGRNLANLLWPLPNSPGSGPARVNNHATSSAQAANEDQGIGRIDHSLSDNWKLFGTYGIQIFNLGGFDPYGNQMTPIDSGRAERNRMQTAVISLIGVFSPRLIGEFRGNVLRSASNRIPMSEGFDLSTLGFPKALADAVQVRAVPFINQVAGFQAFHSSTISRIRRNTTNYAGIASLTFIRDKHTIKTGLQYRTLGLCDFLNNNATPRFAFDGRFTNTQGFGLPEMLYGYAANGSIADSQGLCWTKFYAAPYVQDDWKVTRKLTLNIGLQWSVDTPITERYNRASRLVRDARPRSSEVLGLSYTGTLQFADQNNRRVDEMQWKQWSPRLGFAYQLRPNTVIRGGYSIVWLPSTAYFRASAPTFVQFSQEFVASLDNGVTPAAKISNPFPAGLQKTPGASPDWDRFVFSMNEMTYGNHRNGYTQNWNLDLQRDLGGGMAVDIAYVGSKGTWLPGVLSENQVHPQFASMGAALNQQVPNPFLGYARVGPLAAPTVSRAQMLRPYPQFLNINAGAINIGTSSYHAMEFKFTKRFAVSQIGVTYSITKNITNEGSATTTGFNEPSGHPPPAINFYNRGIERGLNPFDVPQRLVVFYTLELPFGKGKRWLSSSPIANRALGGWELTGIYTAQSGTPIWVSAADRTSLLSGRNRPNSSGQSAHLTGRAQDRLNRWFNTSTFTQPADFTFGNVSRTLPDVRIDGINNLDGGFFKSNRFGADGRFNLQFRAEFFNLFNQARFGYPGNTVLTSNFGVISSQLNRPRLFQLALKFVY
jgi:hypothetical protein